MGPGLSPARFYFKPTKPSMLGHLATRRPLGTSTRWVFLKTDKNSELVEDDVEAFGTSTRWVFQEKPTNTGSLKKMTSG